MFYRLSRIENFLVTVEVMAVRLKPGGRLAEVKVDHQAQKRRQEDDDGETHPFYKYQAEF